MVALKNLYGPLQESKLVEHESGWGFRYPEEYRKFLLQYNGAEPEPRSGFDIEDPAAYGGSNVRNFLGINDSDFDNLIDYLETYEDRICKWLHPIAYDSGGNLILIGISGPNRGKVYFWDHERE